MSMDKRKHSAISSTSDLDSSTSISTPISIPETETESGNCSKSQKKKKKQKAKRAKVDQKETEETEENKDHNPNIGKMSNQKAIEVELKKINDKLSHVVTKDDKTFLRELVKDVFMEVKDSLLSSFKRQIEIIEGELHEKAIENETLKGEIKMLKTEMEKKTEEINHLEQREELEKQKHHEIMNDQEQYSRRNNIRITNLTNDHPKETSEETTEKVLQLLNNKLNMSVSSSDIDIAHRLGQFKQNGRHRPVIVKLLRRQVKNDIMMKRKILKGSNIFINEDLTRLNNEVLSSTRKKQQDEVENSWSVNGKILIKWKSNSSIETVKFADYQKWLDLPWPIVEAKRKS